MPVIQTTTLRCDFCGSEKTGIDYTSQTPAEAIRKVHGWGIVEVHTPDYNEGEVGFIEREFLICSKCKDSLKMNYTEKLFQTLKLIFKGDK